jgi:hypothetical protein
MLDGFADSCPCVPVPAKEIVFGELGALLTTETLPVALPEEVGANRTLKLLDCPAPSEIGNAAPDVLKPLPVAVSCEIVSVPVPVLLT